MSNKVKAAIIAGIFSVIVACIAGAFLLLSTLINKDIITIGPWGSSTPEPTITDPITSQECSIPHSMVAVAVGVTDGTDFSKSDAMNYSVTAYVDNVDEAISELSKCFGEKDIVYAVHVPNLRVTPGNPGSCKLYMNQVSRLKEYSLGWLIGGDNIIPDHFRDNLHFCYE